MMTPREIVCELDRYIIGQDRAKRAVSIALRNRWRRMQLTETLRREIVPKNILMIGPTGVGKTEIARRLAYLADSPFIKVEATKFTEVGYVGRDVESIIRDLMDVTVKSEKETRSRRSRHQVEEIAEETVIDALLEKGRYGTDRQELRVKIRQGELDNAEIDVRVSPVPVSMEIMTPPGMEGLAGQLQGVFDNLNNGKKKTRKMKVPQALKIIAQEEVGKIIDEDDLKMTALEKVEQNGIVFIDEIDKVAKRSEVAGADVSREGVQRDLLPLIEGCTVSTKYGMVKTDHILFIASGAFHTAKPSDLVPELQGRFPIRVELDALTAEQFVRILKEPDVSLVRQYTELIGAENMTIEFTDDAVQRIAEIAYAVNESTENIGARRLHTVMEFLLEDISFNASEHDGKQQIINAEYVDKNLAELAENEDLNRYIL